MIYKLLKKLNQILQDWVMTKLYGDNKFKITTPIWDH